MAPRQRRGLDPFPSAPPVGPESPLGEDDRLFGLLAGGSAVARWLGKRFQARPPHVPARRGAGAGPRSGFVTVALADDFLHADYRKEAVHHAVSQDKVTLNEPYTPPSPASASTTAPARPASTCSRGGGLLPASGSPVLPRRRLRPAAGTRLPCAASSYLADQTVGLLPAYPDEGEFIVGLTGVGPGDSLSLLSRSRRERRS